MSQSMIRSQQLEVGASRLLRNDSNDNSSPVIISKIKHVNQKYSKQNGSERTENGNRRFQRVSKYARNDDQSNGNCIAKSGLQGLITPVVQISYNQIKSEQAYIDLNHVEEYNSKSYSHRSTRIDVFQTASSLNNALGQKERAKSRIESERRSYNKGSFISAKELQGGTSPK
jgi:hypothetical protein